MNSSLLHTDELISFSNSIEIKKTWEKFFNETQRNLYDFKNENNKLKTEVLNIIAENTSLNTKLEEEKRRQANGANGEPQDHATRERLTNEAFKNVKKQTDYLQAENQELRSLNHSFHKTIQNLHYEVQNYREAIFQPSAREEIKDYDASIRTLGEIMKIQKNAIVKQSKIIENILAEKNQLGKRIQSLEATLSEKGRQFGGLRRDKLQAKLAEITRQNKDLKTSLKLSKHVIEERFERERCALQKVQEALAIAETAVSDKEVAARREQVVKEECENLAVTVGGVMEDAARKVEKDIEALRDKFREKECMFSKAQEQLKGELRNQAKYIQILETRCNRYEQKYRETLKENEQLLKELPVNKSTLEELNLKLKAKEEMLVEYKTAKKCNEEYEQEIQQYLQTNKQLKDKYKAAIEDVTERFENEIHRLQIENANLKAGNRCKEVS